MRLTLIAALTWTAAAAAGPPNVVMIISDDQAWTDYSFMGHPHIQTPHIDRLAKEGLTFRRGYVPSSLCRPSLASIVTGLYPHQHKITSNDPPLPKGMSLRRAMRDDGFLKLRKRMADHIEEVPTLPRLLAKRGYVSFQSGKWWEGNHCRCGFDDGMTHGDPKRGGRHGDAGLKIGRQGLKPVFNFIDTAVKQKKPFYVWYAPFMPHSPHTPPQRLLKKYRDKTDSIHVARYWAMCEWFDETVGLTLDRLDELKIAENTVVVYVCDNGWIQSKNSPRYAPKSKRSPYDGGLRTPIIVRRKGHIEPKMSDEPVISTDLAPTILKAAGLEPTAAMQGVNLLDAAAVAKRPRIYGEVFLHNAKDIEDPAANLQYRWTVAGRWKLIAPAKWNAPGGRVELYDLKADPTETKNLAGSQPKIVDKLTAGLNAWWLPQAR